MLDFWKNKRILVTGHTGFKGSWLTEALLLAGAEVTGYALEPPTDPSLFELLKLKDRMRSVTGDIRDLGHLMEVFRETQPEFVLHMAAQPIVRLSYREPVMTYETNVMGTVNICECVRQCPGVRSFLNVTTDKVYENGEKGTGFVETDRLDGYDPYSNSKSCSELVTHGYVRSFLKEQGVAVSTARAGNVIGGGDFAPDRIVPDCVRAAESGSMCWSPSWCTWTFWRSRRRILPLPEPTMWARIFPTVSAPENWRSCSLTPGMGKGQKKVHPEQIAAEKAVHPEQAKQAVLPAQAAQADPGSSGSRSARTEDPMRRDSCGSSAQS